MGKKIICFTVMLIGIVPFVSAATDQFFFELDGGVWFYPGIGAKVGWMRFWNNERIGFVGDVSYYNNGFVDELEGDWREEIKKAHNFGLAAGIVFNNMGFNGVLRTSQHIKIKGFLSVWGKPSLAPGLDVGVKLNLFLIEKTALSAGIGLDMVYFMPYPYISLGMTFTKG